MSENTKNLIKQYFNSLVDQFITDPNHKDITIVFKDYIGGVLNEDKLGNTSWERTGGREHWKETSDGREVPGSRWQEPYKHTYTITFLNNYKNEERWRGTVAHEFAHLYLFSKGDNNHEHDDNFYSKMDYFEDWLDKKWNLSPRKDKGGDWNQHVNYDKRKQRENQYPSQSQNNNFPSWNNNDNYSPPSYHDPQRDEKREFNHVTKLIQDSKTLTDLEKNFQAVKNHTLYSTNKKTWKEGKEENNKQYWDECYNVRKKTMNWDSKREHEERNKFDNSMDNEKKEYNRLVDLMKNAKNLSELEQTYQIVKNSPLYDSNKRTWEKFNNTSRVPEDNKKELDLWYNDFKTHFSSSKSEEPNDYYPTNKDKSNELWILFAVIGGIIIGFYLIFKLFSRLISVRKRKKFKK